MLKFALLAHTPMVYVALLSFIEVAVRTGIELSEMSVSGTVGTKHGAKVRRFYENTKSFGRKMPAFFFY